MGVQQAELSKKIVRMIFGADPGNATMCGVGIDADTGAVLGEVRFPTLKTVTGRGSLREALGRRKALDKGEHVIVTDREGVPFTTYIGTLAERNPNDADIARGGDRRYTNGWTVHFVLAAVASLAPDADEIVVDLRTGVPPKLLTPELEREIAGLYKRRWAFNYNGRDVVVSFSDVHVVEEGYAAWLTLPTEERRGNSLVIDLGGGTINLLVILQDGQIYERFTLAGRGNEFVFDNINAALVESGGREMLPSERRELQEALVSGQSYAVTINGKQRDVTKVARVYIDQNAEQFVQALFSRIPHLNTYTNIFLTGGGARVGLVGGKLLELIPNSRLICDDPEMANARGYAGIERKSRKRGR